MNFRNHTCLKNLKKEWMGLMGHSAEDSQDHGAKSNDSARIKVADQPAMPFVK